MKTILIKIEFKDDHITRMAGERLRHFIEQSFQQKEKIILDFTDVTIASTSFFDEGIAKLAESGWDKKRLDNYIQFKNMHPKDRLVMEKMCNLRKLQ